MVQTSVRSLCAVSISTTRVDLRGSEYLKRGQLQNQRRHVADVMAWKDLICRDRQQRFQLLQPAGRQRLVRRRYALGDNRREMLSLV
jgi:hypothetical protein